MMSWMSRAFVVRVVSSILRGEETEKSASERVSDLIGRLPVV